MKDLFFYLWMNILVLNNIWSKISRKKEYPIWFAIYGRLKCFLELVLKSFPFKPVHLEPIGEATSIKKRRGLVGTIKTYGMLTINCYVKNTCFSVFMNLSLHSHMLHIDMDIHPHMKVTGCLSVCLLKISLTGINRYGSL